MGRQYIPAEVTLSAAQHSVRVVRAVRRVVVLNEQVAALDAAVVAASRLQRPFPGEMQLGAAQHGSFPRSQLIRQPTEIDRGKLPKQRPAHRIELGRADSQRGDPVGLTGCVSRRRRSSRWAANASGSFAGSALPPWCKATPRVRPRRAAASPAAASDPCGTGMWTSCCGPLAATTCPLRPPGWVEGTAHPVHRTRRPRGSTPRGSPSSARSNRRSAAAFAVPVTAGAGMSTAQPQTAGRCLRA